MSVRGVLEGLRGHYVVLYLRSDAVEFTVEGVLEDLSDDLIVLRIGEARRYLSNVVVMEVIDYGRA